MHSFCRRFTIVVVWRRQNGSTISTNYYLTPRTTAPSSGICRASVSYEEQNLSRLRESNISLTTINFLIQFFICGFHILTTHTHQNKNDNSRPYRRKFLRNHIITCIKVRTLLVWRLKYFRFMSWIMTIE